MTTVNEPLSAFAMANYPTQDDYPHHSAITSTVDTGLILYWATSVDGNACFVSLSGDNSVSVIRYATGQESMRVPVGKFPQRSRLAKVRSSVLAKLSPSPG